MCLRTAASSVGPSVCRHQEAQASRRMRRLISSSLCNRTTGAHSPASWVSNSSTGGRCSAGKSASRSINTGMASASCASPSVSAARMPHGGRGIVQQFTNTGKLFHRCGLRARDGQGEEPESEARHTAIHGDGLLMQNDRASAHMRHRRRARMAEPAPLSPRRFYPCDLTQKRAKYSDWPRGDDRWVSRSSSSPRHTQLQNRLALEVVLRHPANVLQGHEDSAIGQCVDAADAVIAVIAGEILELLARRVH